MKRGRPRSARAGAAIGAVLTLTCALLISLALFWPSNEVVWRSCQPAALNYDQASYCISVVEGDLEPGLLSFERNYSIRIGRGTEIRAGHFIDYSFEGLGSQRKANIRKSQSTWSPRGVVFTDSFGRRLFVPKALFIGGR